MSETTAARSKSSVAALEGRIGCTVSDIVIVKMPLEFGRCHSPSTLVCAAGLFVAQPGILEYGGRLFLSTSRPRRGVDLCAVRDLGSRAAPARRRWWIHIE
jgi:hypothetical protein